MSGNSLRRAFVHSALFAIAMLSMGSASILVKLSNASGIACAFWRLFISSALTLIVLTATTRGCRRIQYMDMPRLIGLFVAGVSLALHFILWMESLFLVPVAISVTIVVAYPLHLALVELVKKREQRSLTAISGLVIGFLGTIMLFREALVSVELNVIGIIMSFTASIFATTYFYLGKMLRRSIDVLHYTLYVYSIASLVVLVCSVIVAEDVFVYLPRSWPWFLLLALIPMLGGHSVMNYMLKFYRSSTVTSIALAEPVIASILASLLLRETIKPQYMVCLAMVLLGIAVVALSESLYRH